MSENSSFSENTNSASYTSDQTSSTLLHAAQLGDDDAWSRMVKKYSPMIYRRCRRQGLSINDADTITQEVFLELFKRIERFQRQRKGSFRKFVGLVVHSRITDFFRSLKKAPGSLTDSQLFALPFPTDGASNTDQQEKSFTEIRHALSKEFSDRDWVILYRSVGDETAPVEIAEELGISVNTVYLVKSRMLKRLREIFTHMESK
ncbi:RNA polymerase sigma factor [Calycomorphotria hydatis]|nr:sigma-70 family RNA polymerase sigma factor [Calycomorphotria hydatis]